MVDQVRDNPAEGRFELDVVGTLAFAEYRLEGQIMTFTHTEVPAVLSGQGVGSRLIKNALEQVRARGLKIVPACSFVAGYIGKHPEYADLLA